MPRLTVESAALLSIYGWMLTLQSMVGQVALGTAAQELAGELGSTWGSDLGETRDRPCGDGVLEYISGKKANATIIPYSTECILEYQRHGHELPPPRSVAVHLKGIPKTGTTWVEFFIRSLMSDVCESGIYSGCSSRVSSTTTKDNTRMVEMFIPAPSAADREPGGDEGGGGDGMSFAILGLYVHKKHVLTYNSTCQGLTSPAERGDCLKRKSFYTLLTKRKSVSGVPWLRCASEGPYSEIARCVPAYMKEAKFSRRTNKFLEENAAQRGMQIAVLDDSRPARKYIVTVRDPRDTGVSLAHFAGKWTPEAMMKAFGCKAQTAAAAFFYHWQVERQGKVYPTMELWYREAMDKTFETFEETLRFFGLRATRETLEKVIHTTSFESMKKLESDSKLPGPNRPGTDLRKVRKGGYGGFKEELSEETIALCNAEMRRALPERMQRSFGVI